MGRLTKEDIAEAILAQLNGIDEQSEYIVGAEGMAEEMDYEQKFECSACNVIQSIDDVIINTLAQEGKLDSGSVENMYKLAKIREMYL